MLSQGVKSELGRCMKKYCKYVWSYFEVLVLIDEGDYQLGLDE